MSSFNCDVSIGCLDINIPLLPSIWYSHRRYWLQHRTAAHACFVGKRTNRTEPISQTIIRNWDRSNFWVLWTLGDQISWPWILQRISQFGSYRWAPYRFGSMCQIFEIRTMLSYLGTLIKGALWRTKCIDVIHPSHLKCKSSTDITVCFHFWRPALYTI